MDNLASPWPGVGSEESGRLGFGRDRVANAMTPLMRSSLNGLIEVMRALLEAEAGVDTQAAKRNAVFEPLEEE